MSNRRDPVKANRRGPIQPRYSDPHLPCRRCLQRGLGPHLNPTRFHPGCPWPPADPGRTPPGATERGWMRWLASLLYPVGEINTGSPQANFLRLALPCYIMLYPVLPQSPPGVSCPWFPPWSYGASCHICAIPFGGAVDLTLAGLGFIPCN